MTFRFKVMCHSVFELISSQVWCIIITCASPSGYGLVYEATTHSLRRVKSSFADYLSDNPVGLDLCQGSTVSLARGMLRRRRWAVFLKQSRLEATLRMIAFYLWSHLLFFGNSCNNESSNSAVVMLPFACCRVRVEWA